MLDSLSKIDPEYFICYFSDYGIEVYCAPSDYKNGEKLNLIFNTISMSSEEGELILETVEHLKLTYSDYYTFNISFTKYVDVNVEETLPLNLLIRVKN